MIVWPFTIICKYCLKYFRINVNNVCSVSVQLTCLLSLYVLYYCIHYIIYQPHWSTTEVSLLLVALFFFLSNVVLYLNTQRRCVLGKNSIHICEVTGSYKNKLLWFILTNAHYGTLSLLTFRASFHYLIDYERAVIKFLFPWPAEKVSILPQQAYIMRDKNLQLKTETSVKPV